MSDKKETLKGKEPMTPSGAKVLANYGNGHHAKNVYDSDGLAPTITMGNHGLGTAIACTILSGSLNKYGFGQADHVWSTDGISPTIITGGSQIGHQINIMERCELLGNVDAPTFNEMTSRVYSPSGMSPTIRTFCGGGHETKIGEDMGKLRIRKLTEGECMRLMGFEKKDTDACKAVGLSRANVYHQAGDSIVTTVLVGIFGELLGADYGSAIDGYAERLHKETEPRESE